LYLSYPAEQPAEGYAVGESGIIDIETLWRR
jgi:hypothetical protein